MTVSQKWRRALLAGLTVPALALTACSMGEDGDGGDGADSPSASQTEDGDDINSDESELVANLDLDGAPGDFRPTAPGTGLDLGEAGYVVTRDGEGEERPLQFWKVTALDTEVLDVGEIPLTEGSEDVENFVCLPYEVELLGVGAGQEDEDGATLAPPALVPSDDDGAGANVIEQVDPALCGVDEEDVLPGDLADVEEGTTYRGAAVSYVDKERTRGINATGLAFTYDLSTEDPGAEDPGAENPGSEPGDDSADEEPILWN